MPKFLEVIKYQFKVSDFVREQRGFKCSYAIWSYSVSKNLKNHQNPLPRNL